MKWLIRLGTCSIQPTVLWISSNPFMFDSYSIVRCRSCTWLALKQHLYRLSIPTSTNATTYTPFSWRIVQAIFRQLYSRNIVYRHSQLQHEDERPSSHLKILGHKIYKYTSTKGFLSLDYPNCGQCRMLTFMLHSCILKRHWSCSLRMALYLFLVSSWFSKDGTSLPNMKINYTYFTFFIRSASPTVLHLRHYLFHWFSGLSEILAWESEALIPIDLPTLTDQSIFLIITAFGQVLCR